MSHLSATEPGPGSPSLFRGNAALSSDHSMLIVDNLLDRNFDVYSFPSVARPSSLTFSDRRRYPKQCTFSDAAKVAVFGSTINKVYVVNVIANEIIQTLHADGESRIPLLALIIYDDLDKIIVCCKPSLRLQVTEMAPSSPVVRTKGQSIYGRERLLLPYLGTISF